MIARKLIVPLVVVALAASPAAAARRWLKRVPRSFVAAALCVHDGWHHQARPPWRRTWNVPDHLRGGTGESSWHYRGYFRGGMQWTFGTWREAGGRGDPADALPGEEIYRAYRIVRKRGTWHHDWPLTSRACGLG